MTTCPLSLRWQKTVKENSQGCYTSSYRVPAKALLFGEYGLLRGGCAAVVLLPQYGFRLSFMVKKSVALEQSYVLRSDFFTEDVTLSRSLLNSEEQIGLSEEQRNLCSYLSQYRNELLNSTLFIEILEAYSPALGFGSSSAIQSAIHLFFARLNMPEEIQFEQLGTEFWAKAFRTLQTLQGRGSGYDVAVQIFGALHSKLDSPCLLSFRNEGLAHVAGDSFFPKVSQLAIDSCELRKFGCFVETGVHSNTRAVLKETQGRRFDDFFFSAQKELAHKFIADPCVDSAAQLCRVASGISLQYGLLPMTHELLCFTDTCREANIPWKTMGAGFGDCLWVLASRAQIDEILRQNNTTGLKVSYAFEDI